MIIQQDAFSTVEGGDNAEIAYLAYAQTLVRRIAETCAGHIRPGSAGAVGGGAMGAGIAVALDAGLPVKMQERDNAALKNGMLGVQALYRAMAAKRRLTHEDAEARLARLTGNTSYDALTEADFVIEAVFEDLAVKQAVFRELDRVCKPQAILATNTSYLASTPLRASRRVLPMSWACISFRPRTS